MIDFVTGTEAVEVITEATNALIEMYQGYTGATAGGYVATNIGGQTVIYTNATTAEALSITAGTATEASTAAASNMMGETVSAAMINSSSTGVSTGLLSTVGTALGYTVVAGLLAYMGYKLTRTAYEYDPTYWDGVITDILGENPHVLFSGGDVLIPESIANRAYEFAAGLSVYNVGLYDQNSQTEYENARAITDRFYCQGSQQAYGAYKQLWFTFEMTITGGFILLKRGLSNAVYWYVFSESQNTSPVIHVKKTYQYNNGTVTTFEYTDDQLTYWNGVNNNYTTLNGRRYYRMKDSTANRGAWDNPCVGYTSAIDRQCENDNLPAGHGDTTLNNINVTGPDATFEGTPFPDVWGSFPDAYLEQQDFITSGSPQIDRITGATTPVSAGDIATSYPDWWRWQVLNNIKPDANGQPTTVPDADADRYIPIVPMSDPAIEDATAAVIADNQNIGELTDGQKREQIAPETIPEIVIGSQIVVQPELEIGINPTIPIGDDTGTISTPSITYDSTDTGFIAIYHPTKAQLKTFNQWLWSIGFDLDTFKKLFQDPMQAIISLHQIYCTPTDAGTTNIKVGYLDSGVSSYYVTNNIVTIDCGTKFVPYFYKNALDCIGSTEVDIFLPFIGFRTLNINDINNSNVNVTYNIDILSGACCATISVQKSGLDAVLYTFNGNCAAQLPVTSANFSGMIQGLIGTVAGAGAALLTGGSAMPFMAAGVNNMLSGKVGIERSGNISGNVGALAEKIPYIVIRRPIAKTAYQYNKFMGYPASSNIKLSNCRGFTRIKEIVLDSIQATSDEKNELESLLKRGVIL